MRRIAIALILLTSPVTAAAHETGFAHTHEIEPGAKREGVSLVAHGGYAFGPSLGGDYEKCEDATTCIDRKRPSTPVFGARGGYEWSNGVGVEVGLMTFTGVSMRVHRATTLLGEQVTPANVDITDEVSASGPAVGVGVSYTPIHAPITLTVAVEYAHWFASFSSTRSGTVEVDKPPSPRPLITSTSTADNGDSTGYELFMPQLRAGYPITRNFVLGIELAAILGFGEARPKVTSTAQTTPDDPRPSSGGRTLGFLPQPNSQPQSAMENFFLFRPSLFAKVIF